MSVDVARYSPFDPAVQADPYPYYEELRRGPSAAYVPADDVWVVSKFDHVWNIARSPESYSSKALTALGVGAISTRHGVRPDIRALNAKVARSLIATDPPDHTRLRRLVSRPFTRRAIANLSVQVRTICNDAVDDLLEAQSHGDADLVRDFNFPLPILTIAAALGIPGERREDFRRWSNALIGRFDGQPLPLDAVKDLEEMTSYFRRVIAERTKEPGDDLISWIIAGAEQGDDPLEPRDIVSFCSLLLVAGNETTTNLLGNLFQAFFDHPDQFAMSWQAEDLTPVVEEILRFDSSVQGIVRLTNDEVAVGEVVIPRDQVVFIMFGSANRDEARWPDGNRFDVRRTPQDHLGFGSGIHLCLGAHLARLEVAIAMDVMRTRLESIEARGAGTRCGSSILRGFSSLPVEVIGR